MAIQVFPCLSVGVSTSQRGGWNRGEMRLGPPELYKIEVLLFLAHELSLFSLSHAFDYQLDANYGCFAFS